MVMKATEATNETSNKIVPIARFLLIVQAFPLLGGMPRYNTAFLDLMLSFETNRSKNRQQASIMQV
jgi:hypothetical protein